MTLGLKKHVSSASGATLLEMLMYAAILAVVLNVAAQTLLSCMRLSSYGTAIADRMGQVSEVEKVFRQSVREGDALAPKAGVFTEGPGVVIVRKPTTEPGVLRFTALGALRSPNQFSKAELRSDAAGTQIEALTTYPLKLATLHFAHDGASRLVTVELTASSARKSSNIADKFVFSTGLCGIEPAPEPPVPAATADTKPTETKPAESKPADTKPAETKPTETKPAESKPADTKPTETKPAETKPAETKTAETKPAETKPAETKPAETKPAETKPAETKPAETKPSGETGK